MRLGPILLQTECPLINVESVPNLITGTNDRLALSIGAANYGGRIGLDEFRYLTRGELTTVIAVDPENRDQLGINDRKSLQKTLGKNKIHFVQCGMEAVAAMPICENAFDDILAVEPSTNITPFVLPEAFRMLKEGGKATLVLGLYNLGVDVYGESITESPEIDKNVLKSLLDSVGGDGNYAPIFTVNGQVYSGNTDDIVPFTTAEYLSHTSMYPESATLTGTRKKIIMDEFPIVVVEMTKVPYELVY